MKRNTIKHGFVSLSVLLMNSNIEEIDDKSIAEILFAYANANNAPFLTDDVVKGEYIDNYVELINRERLSMKWAQECFEHIFEEGENPYDSNEQMYSADNFDLKNQHE